jgi:hypothetical protein
MISQKNVSTFHEINIAKIKRTAFPPTMVGIRVVLDPHLGHVIGYPDIFVFLVLPGKFGDYISIMPLLFPSKTFPSHYPSTILPFNTADLRYWQCCGITHKHFNKTATVIQIYGYLHLCICAKSNEEKKERKRVKT